MTEISAARPGASQAPAGWATAVRARHLGWAGALGAITALACLPRLIALGWLPVWRDEAFTGVVARRSLDAMLAAVSHDSHPPLSFLAVHLLGAFGLDNFTLRLSSALAGVAAVPLAAALARRVDGERAGLVTAGVVAALPSAILLSRDARMYALALTLVLASVLALWRALERPSPGRLAVFAACAALAAYTHYFAGLAVAVALVAAAIGLRPGRRALLLAGAAGGVAALALVPWLLAARAQFQHTGFWVPPPNLGSIVGMAAQPLTGQPVSRGDGWQWLVPVADELALGAGVVALAAMAISLRRSAPARRGAVAFLGLTWVGLVIALLAISLKRPIFDPRYASVAWGPAYVVLGLGLARLRTAWLVPVLALLAVAGLTITVSDRNADFEPLAARLDRQVQPGDVVVLGTPRAYFPVLYYVAPRIGPQVHLVSVRPISWFYGTSAFLPGTRIEAVPDPATGTLYLLLEAGVKTTVRAPADLVLRDRFCSSAGCLLTYTR